MGPVDGLSGLVLDPLPDLRVDGGPGAVALVPLRRFAVEVVPEVFGLWYPLTRGVVDLGIGRAIGWIETFGAFAFEAFDLLRRRRPLTLLFGGHGDSSCISREK
jgi:hypothetical protein